MTRFVEILTLGHDLGSGCRSFGRAVVSNTRNPRFESSHWQNFIMNIFTVIVEKTKITKKRPG